ncbi:MAG: hypothetical protein JJE36_05575 [Coriobacteriia bacterium]|nr:hypothetical protein [Coriobacteriia bacterium]
MHTAQQSALLDIQKIDVEGRTIMRSFNQHPAHAKIHAIEKAIGQLEVSRVKAEENAHDFELKITAGQDEVLAAQAKIDDERKQLATIFETRSIQALSKDIEAQIRRIDKIEYGEIAYLEQQDATMKQESEIAEKIEKLFTARAKLEEGLASLKSQVDVKVEELKAARAKAEKHVPAETLDRYKAISLEKSGVAVGELIDNACSMCRVKFSYTQIDDMAEHEGAIVVCPSCKRLLVVPKND